MARIGIEDRGLTKTQEQPIGLDEIRRRIQVASREGNIEEIAKLNALAQALLTRIQRDIRSDPTYSRTQFNRQSASPEDIQAADDLNARLGEVRQIADLTQYASNQRISGNLPAAAFGAPVLGQIAGEAIAAPRIASSAKAAGGIEGEIAVEAVRAKAQRDVSKELAKGAKDKLAPVHGGVERALSTANRPPGSPTTAFTQAADRNLDRVGKAAAKTTKKALPGIRATEVAARRAAAEYAVKKGQAKAAQGLGQIAVHAAPRIFGGMAIGLVETAISPLLTFYSSTEALATDLGQLENMASVSQGPLSLEHLSGTAMGDMVYRAPPELLSILQEKGIVDENVAAAVSGHRDIVEPTYDPDIEAKMATDSERRLSTPPVYLPPGFQSTAEEMEKIGGSVPRIGADEAGLSTPVVRRRAAERAFARREGRLTDIGQKPEGDMPDIANEPAAPPKPTRVTLETPEGNRLQAWIADQKKKGETPNIMKNILKALQGSGESPKSAGADLQTGEVLQ